MYIMAIIDEQVGQRGVHEIKVASLKAYPFTSTPADSPGARASGPVILSVAGFDHFKAISPEN